MKKGKVLSVGQIGMVAMVLVLAGAVWLNMKYSSAKETTKYMGETTLVDNQSTNAALVGAEVEEDYFSSAAADREASYKEAEDIIKESLASSDKEVQKSASEMSAALAKRKTDETSIENLLKAKGFEKALVIIGEESVTVVVESDGLDNAQTVQIQDAVMSLCSVSLSNIKIVSVSG